MLWEPHKVEVGPEMEFCADASSIAGGLTMNASSLLCYCILWGEKWTYDRYTEASRYLISWPRRGIHLQEPTLRSFLASFPLGKGTLSDLTRWATMGWSSVLLLNTNWMQRDNTALSESLHNSVHFALWMRNNRKIFCHSLRYHLFKAWDNIQMRVTNA